MAVFSSRLSRGEDADRQMRGKDAQRRRSSEAVADQQFLLPVRLFTFEFSYITVCDVPLIRLSAPSPQWRIGEKEDARASCCAESCIECETGSSWKTGGKVEFLGSPARDCRPELRHPWTSSLGLKLSDIAGGGGVVATNLVPVFVWGMTKAKCGVRPLSSPLSQMGERAG